MADFNNGDFLYGSPVKPPVSDTFKVGSEYYEAEALETKRSEKNIVEKLNTSVDAFAQTSLAVNIATSVQEDYVAKQFNPDQDYIDNRKMDQESLFHMMATKGIPNKYFEDLDMARSEGEFSFRLKTAMQDMRVEKEINETLTNGERMSATVASALVSVETLAFGGAGMMYNAGAKVATIAVYEGAAEAAVAGANMAYTEGYHESSIIPDIMLGIGVSVGASKLLGGFRHTEGDIEDVSHFAKNMDSKDMVDYSSTDGYASSMNVATGKVTISKVDDATLSQSTLDTIEAGKAKQRTAIASKERDRISTQEKIEGTPEYKAKLDRSIETRIKIYKAMGKSPNQIDELIAKDFVDSKPKSWIEEHKEAQSKLDKDRVETEKKIAQAEEDFKYNVGKDVDKAKKAENTLADMRSKSAELRQKAREDEVKDLELKADGEKAILQQEEELAEQKAINQELANRFNNPKYKPYNENRRLFFEEQSKAKVKADGGKIAELTKSIDSMVTKMKEQAKLLRKLKKNKDATPEQIKYRERKVRELNRKIDASKSDLDSIQQTKQITPLNARLLNLVDDVVGDISETVEDILKSAKTLSNTEAKTLLALADDINAKYPKEFKPIYDIIKSKAMNKESTDIAIKSITSSKKLSTKQKVALAGLVMVVASNANASDGSDVAINGALIIAGVVATVVLGPVAIQAIKSGSAKAMVKNSYNKVRASIGNAEVAQSQEGRAASKLRESLATTMHTRLTSTIAPFEKAGGEIGNIIGSLLWSAKNGWGAEVLKQQNIRSAAAAYTNAEKKAFKLWKKENGLPTGLNLAEDGSTIARFREEAMNFMEDRVGDSKAVKDLSDTMDNLLEDMYMQNKSYKTFGFDKLEYKKGMMPRLWKGSSINQLLNKLSPEDVLKVKGGLAKTIFKGMQKKSAKFPDKKVKVSMEEAEKKAEEMVDRWAKNSLPPSGKTADDIYSSLEGMFKEDTDMNDVLEKLNVGRDRNARAKERVYFEVNDFRENLKEIKVDIDGEQTGLDINMFLDRNVKSVMDKTSNQLYSSAALSSAGYKTTQQLITAIDNSGVSGKLKDDAMKIVDLMSGIPVGVSDDTIHKFSMVMKDATVITKLGLSPISTTQEIMNLIGTHGLVKALGSLSRNFRKEFGNNSTLLNQLEDLTGQGTAVTRHDTSFQGFSDDILGAEDVDVVSSIRNKTMKMRDLVLLPLGGMSDMIQKAAMQLDSSILAKKLLGTDTKGYRWDGIHISDDVVFTANDFKFNSNGQLEQLNMNNWSQQKTDAYRQMLFSMNQRITLEQTLGETPLFSRTSDFGRALTTIMSYTLGEFNAHKIQDIRYLDRMAFTHSVAGFSAVYIGTYLRASINNREVDEDQTLRYALAAAIPPAAVFGLAGSVANPAFMQTVNDTFSVASLRK